MPQAAASWGDLTFTPMPVASLLVCFATPQEDDFDVGGLVSLPARQTPTPRGALYALAINRYNKLVIADRHATLDALRHALAERADVLCGDASASMNSAIVSGAYAAEFLSRGVDVDIVALRDGAYVRCQLEQTAIVIHRDGDRFCLHWPEALTEYVVQWMGAVITLERH